MIDARRTCGVEADSQVSEISWHKDGKGGGETECMEIGTLLYTSLGRKVMLSSDMVPDVGVAHVQ